MPHRDPEERRICNNAASKRYRATHPASRRDRKKQNAANKRYYERNKAKVLAKNAAWDRDNRERRAEMARRRAAWPIKSGWERLERGMSIVTRAQEEYPSFVVIHGKQRYYETFHQPLPAW